MVPAPLHWSLPASPRKHLVKSHHWTHTYYAWSSTWTLGLPECLGALTAWSTPLCELRADMYQAYSKMKPHSSYINLLSRHLSACHTLQWRSLRVCNDHILQFSMWYFQLYRLLSFLLLDFPPLIPSSSFSCFFCPLLLCVLSFLFPFFLNAEIYG